MLYLLKVAVERNWNYMDQDILNHVYQKKIKYLNQSWNCVMDWREPNASRMAILKDAPFALYNEYLEARKNPKIVHYAGYQKPWNVPACDFAEYFWKYARQTVFYEEILKRFVLATTQNTVSNIERNLKSRKYLLKWIIGEGRFGKFVRKIWRKLRRR